VAFGSGSRAAQRAGRLLAKRLPICAGDVATRVTARPRRTASAASIVLLRSDTGSLVGASTTMLMPNKSGTDRRPFKIS